MNNKWYRQGRVSVKTGSRSVDGTGTRWLEAGIKAGDVLILNDAPYEISSVEAGDKLLFVEAYRGETAVGANYAIVQLAAATTQADIAQRLQDAIDLLKELIKKEGESGGGSSSVLTLSITIPASGWAKDETDETGYPYHIDIANAAITAEITPWVTVSRASLPAAEAAGLCPTAETLAGALRVYAKKPPSANIAASLALYGADSDAGGIPVVIPASGWTRDLGDASGFPWRLDIPCSQASADRTPFLAVARASLPAAEAAGLCPTVETLAGAIRVCSASVPETDISASLALYGAAGGGGSPASYPVATKDTLGMIKAGHGLDVASDGTASVNIDEAKTATNQQVEDLLDRIFNEDSSVEAGGESMTEGEEN